MTGHGPDDPGDRSDDGREETAERQEPSARTPEDVVDVERAGAREGRERLWRSLRTLVGLLLLSWLLAALFAPPDPFTFLLVLVPSWLVAVPLAWYLVYRNGYERLRASGLYDPSVSPAQALASFVVLAVVLKVVGTLALDLAAGPRPYVVDAGLSILALAVAYGLVYLGAPERSAAGTE